MGTAPSVIGLLLLLAVWSVWPACARAESAADAPLLRMLPECPNERKDCISTTFHGERGGARFAFLRLRDADRFYEAFDKAFGGSGSDLVVNDTHVRGKLNHGPSRVYRMRFACLAETDSWQCRTFTNFLGYSLHGNPITLTDQGELEIEQMDFRFEFGHAYILEKLSDTPKRRILLYQSPYSRSGLLMLNGVFLYWNYRLPEAESECVEVPASPSKRLQARPLADCMEADGAIEPWSGDMWLLQNGRFSNKGPDYCRRSNVDLNTTWSMERLGRNGPHVFFPYASWTNDCD